MLGRFFCCGFLGRFCDWFVFFEIFLASMSVGENFLSYEVPTVDALAPRTDEGRGWLRNAVGSRLPGFDPWMSE